MTNYASGMGVGEGFNPAIAYTVSTSTPEYPGTPVAVGTTVKGTDGSDWTFIKAGGVITAGDFVIITTNSTWIGQSVTSTLGKGKLGQMVGVAGATAAANDYIWVQRTGYNSSVACATSSTAFTTLHTGATAGRSTTTSVGGTSAIIAGVVVLATAASNVAAAFLNWPVIGADD